MSDAPASLDIKRWLGFIHAKVKEKCIAHRETHLERAKSASTGFKVAYRVKGFCLSEAYLKKGENCEEPEVIELIIIEF